MTDTADIALNPDQQAVICKTAKDLQFTMAALIASIEKKGSVSEGLATDALRLSEHHLAAIGKLLNIPTETAREIEARSEKLRAANLRIRALETQLGDVQAPELTQMSLRNLSRQLNRWWDHEGFGHISDMHFGPHGCEVKFSCNLFGNFRLIKSPTPVSDKERRCLWHESLFARGFVLVDEDRDKAVLDCDQNRDVLTRLFVSRMPSSSVMSFENYHREGGGFVMKDVKVFVRNIADIFALPVPEAAGE